MVSTQGKRPPGDTDWIQMSLFTTWNGESALEVMLSECQMCSSSSASNCGSVVASQLSHQLYFSRFLFIYLYIFLQLLWCFVLT